MCRLVEDSGGGGGATGAAQKYFAVTMETEWKWTGGGQTGGEVPPPPARARPRSQKSRQNSGSTPTPRDPTTVVTLRDHTGNISAHTPRVDKPMLPHDTHDSKVRYVTATPGTAM